MNEAGELFGACVVAALVVAFVALPARAALFDDEEARRRIADTQVRLTNVQNQLEARLAAIEGQLKNQGLVDLLSHVEQLKTDVARLRGQIEVLINEQDQLQSASAISTSISTRDCVAWKAVRVPTFRRLPAALPACRQRQRRRHCRAATARSCGEPRGASAAGAPDSGLEQRAYDLALDQFKAANYPGAIASFNAFVKTYPKSPLASSAYYWIGNSQFAQRDYKGGDRHAAAAHHRLSGQCKDPRRAAQYRREPVRNGRCRGVAAHARGIDREAPAVRCRGQGEAASRDPLR